MTHDRPPRRPRVDVPALVIGLVLAPLAGLAIWTSLDLPVSWAPLLIAGPIALIGIGGLGLALSRGSS